MSTTTKTIGKVSVVPKGTWAAGTSYSRLDIVSYEGSSYIAAQDAPAGIPLANTSYWEMIASIGSPAPSAMVASAAISATESWLAANISNPTNPVIDNTLSLNNAAANAKKTGLISAPYYSATASYEIGDYVNYQGVLYKCNTAIPSGIPWNNIYWTATNTGKEISELRNDLNTLNEGGLILEENFIKNEIDDWLDYHPEATTTVQDGSLTEVKFVDSLKAKTIKDYVTPQMFGAVGDGVTDDTQAIQDACNYAKAHGEITVLFYTDHYVTSTIEVPTMIALIGYHAAEYTAPRIYFARDIGVVFRSYVGNWFENLRIRPKGNYWAPVVGFEVSGNAGHNADTYFIYMNIAYCETGIVGYGRNIEVRDSLIGHCRYGVHFYIPEDAIWSPTTDSSPVSGKTYYIRNGSYDYSVFSGSSFTPGVTYYTLSVSGYRGMHVKGVRFHGIGEEMETVDGQQVEMLNTGNTACVLVELDNSIYTNAKTQVADLVIDSCIADQGAGLVRGYAQFAQITNNYVKVFELPAIEIDTKQASSMHSWLIQGNMFIGCGNVDGIGVIHDIVPAYLVTIKDHSFATVNENFFVNYSVSAILLDTVSRISINGNQFDSPFSGLTPAIRFTNSVRIINIQNNVSRGQSQPLLAAINEATDTIHVYMSGNNNFVEPDTQGYWNRGADIGITPFNNKTQYRYLGQYVPGTAGFSYKAIGYELLFRRIDTVTAFTGRFVEVINSSGVKVSTYFTSTTHATNEYLEWLAYDHITDTLYLKRMNYETKEIINISQTLLMFALA